MCKYCKRGGGVSWSRQEKFTNTEEEFKTINRQRIWSSANKRNSTYAIIQDYAGMTPDYEGKVNGRIVIRLPEIDVDVDVSVNYCPFCGKKLGDTCDKFI